jgi:antitoxin HicB
VRYVVVLTADPEGHGYTVTVPALPGCITEGKTVDEALARVRDAIVVYLDGEIAGSLATAGVDPNVIVAEIDVPTPV